MQQNLLTTQQLGTKLTCPASLRCSSSCTLPHISCFKISQQVNAKTISNWLVASMWGNPVEQQSGGNSTPMGIQNFIQYIKGLPSFLDETTQHPEVAKPVSYTHLRAHETDSYLVCRL